MSQHGFASRLVNALLFGATLALASPAVHATLGETPEIVYSGADAQALRDKAAELGTAVAMYEYAHNTFEFSPYHGSRSGSVNSFLGQRGSDVDIASTLIAMLRSQGIPARYAVGTVRLPADQLNNWLGVGSLDVAVQVLKDQGIQGVTVAADRSTVDFEHAWAEAFVPFDQYRGADVVSPPVDCAVAAEAFRCTWVALDASFKQKTYNGLNLDPYNAVSFDYTAYYNAIKNNDPARRDKNPLAILEDQIGEWLRANHPGKTLEDVENAGKINEIHEGLLPASLPYQVVGTVRRYDTVAAHDAVVPASEPKKWGKRLIVDFSMRYPLSSEHIILGDFLLVDLNNKRLTLSTEFNAQGNTCRVILRLGGTAGILVNLTGYTPRLGDPFTIKLSMDGSPSIDSEPEHPIVAEYDGIVGGYYLIASGGEISNWSQVHRAADQLLVANGQYKIVFNPGQAGCLPDGINCTPYVDTNSNGWDGSDTPLLESMPALDALTGGLLYVAATQYFATMREQFERADRLMKAKLPLRGFVGVVSSVYEAEYIDDTAFSILPGGLLIDMKGMSLGGSWRANEGTLTFSNQHVDFLGHVGSSLEHEIWQELTGYDAVSTVRGIQMGLADGASLVNVKRNTTIDTVPGFLSTVGFGGSAPSPFALVQHEIYGTRPITWSHPTTTGSEGFHIMKKSINGSTDSRRFVVAYMNDFWHAAVSCFDNNEDALNNLRATHGGSGQVNAGTFCGVSWGEGTTIDTAISLLQGGYANFRQANADLFNYLDASQGFVSTDFGYRNINLPIDAYSTDTIVGIRNDLQLQDINQTWAEYTLPSTLVTGTSYRFDVNIRKAYFTSNAHMVSMFYQIANKSF